MIAYCKVKIYNADINSFEDEHCLISTASFTDAAKQLEDYYGNDLEEMSIFLYDIGLFHFNPKYSETVTQILEEGSV